MMSRGPEETVDLIHYHWRTPENGHVWRDDMCAQDPLGGEGKPPFLTVNNASTSQYSDPKTLPFDEPGEERVPLFEKFAKLKATQEAIRRFADMNSWLGVGERVCPPGKPAEVTRGEPLNRWRREISAMRVAVTLWKWLNRERWGGKQDGSVGVTWLSDDCVEVSIQWGDRESRRNILLRREFLPDFSLLCQNNPELSVKMALVRHVNKNLAEVAYPVILLNRHRNLQGFTRPRHFLGALWIQFYQAIQGWRQIRSCKYCNELMDVTGGRSTKVAHQRCVNRVKTAKYKQRRKKERNTIGRTRTKKQPARHARTSRK